jgi:hypothetical protein
VDGDGDAVRLAGFVGSLTMSGRVAGSAFFTNETNAIAGRRECSVTTKRTPSQAQPLATHSLIACSSVSSVTIESSTIL